MAQSPKLFKSSMNGTTLQAERLDITLNKSHQDNQDDSNVSISLFIDDDFSSVAINNVNQKTDMSY